MSLTTINDLPANLVDDVLNLLGPVTAVDFATSSEPLVSLTAQSLTCWSQGGALYDHWWFAQMSTHVTLLRARNAFIREVSGLDSEPWEFHVALLELSSYLVPEVLELTHVTSLIVADGSCLGNADLKKLVASMPRLNALTLYNIGFVADEGVSSVLDLKSLTSLRLNGSEGVTEGALLRLTELVNLEILELSQIESVTDSVLTTLALLKKLRSLHLWTVPQVTEAGFACISNIVSLEDVRIGASEHICDEIVERLSTLPNLRSLKFSSKTNLTDRCSVAIAQCDKLTTLALTQCAEVTDATLLNIANLKLLTSLTISGCSISDVGLSALSAGEAAPCLTYLDISSCRCFTEAAAGAASISKLKGLSTLLLSGLGDSVTDKFLSGIAQLPLTTLAISGCHKVTDGGLDHIACIKTLRTLDSSELPLITEKGVEQLLQRLPRLRDLRVMSCSGLSEKFNDRIRCEVVFV